MNKEFKHIILDYIDRNYYIKDNFIQFMRERKMFSSMAYELCDIFGISFQEGLYLLKQWIEPKLTTDDKSFGIRLSTGIHSAKYRIIMSDGSINCVFGNYIKNEEYENTTIHGRMFNYDRLIDE